MNFLILKKLFLYGIYAISNKLNNVELFLLNKGDLLKFNLVIKFSLLFNNTVLLDLIVYESNYNNKLIFIYSYKLLNNNIYLLTCTAKKYINSIEFFFKNASWLEREVSDFFNIFFKNKKDRRTLFSIPLIYSAPLKKSFPTNGFYEIFLCFFLKKLKFKHVSSKN